MIAAVYVKMIAKNEGSLMKPGPLEVEVQGMHCAPWRNVEGALHTLEGKGYGCGSPLASNKLHKEKQL